MIKVYDDLTVEVENENGVVDEWKFSSIGELCAWLATVLWQEPMDGDVVEQVSADFRRALARINAVEEEE